MKVALFRRNRLRSLYQRMPVAMPVASGLFNHPMRARPKNIQMANDGDGNDHPAQQGPALTFNALNQAWWNWVNTNCPSKAKRVRGRWMHENVFTFDGTTWRRDRGTMKSNSGKTTYTTSETFFGGDGWIVHRDGGTILNRSNDPARNWGLPD